MFPLLHGLSTNGIAPFLRITGLVSGSSKLVSRNFLPDRNAHLSMELSLFAAGMKVLGASAARQRGQSRTSSPAALPTCLIFAAEVSGC